MARRFRRQKKLKDSVGISALIVISVVLLVLFFMPKPLTQEDSIIIAKDALISDPILMDIHTRINIEIIQVEDSDLYWRVVAMITCKPTAERAKLCVPSELVEKGVYSLFVVYVDKLNGQSTIIYPRYSVIAKF
ncbi:MAG: hypothetical protein Q8R00_05220 [Candidatus Nanoarchaeia archaeon]|nr:hypothetical protein [Candidatus Nanoarchaeia archaeon]